LFLEGEKAGNNLRIRFFGGEPILNFSVIQKTIDFVNQRQKGVVFDITTNGHFLTERILGKIKNQLNLELILSSDSSRIITPIRLKKISLLANISVNFNLWPRGLKKAPKILEFFIDNGFRKFNFLPAFYIDWSQGQLVDLKDCFNSLVEIVEKSAGVSVKNLTVNSSLPLFNTALTIDCNGDVYAGNLFLDKRLKFLKNEMKLGKIDELNSLKSVELPVQFDFENLLRMFFEKRVLESTDNVNQILTDFCQKIK
jgi:MoaA/NifB/PqqE/SkfB family radical SAM enzyme